MSRRLFWSVLPLLPLFLFTFAVTPLRAQPALAGPTIAISPPSVNHFTDMVLATRPGGGFFAVWQDSLDLFARGYDAQGRPTFPLRALGRGDMFDAASMGSGFVVAGLTDRDTYPIRYARIYNASGRPQGSPIPIETSETSPRAASPRVTADRSGGFIVAWVGAAGALSPEEVFLRRFDAQGVARGEPRRVVRTSGASGVCCVDIAQAPGGEVLVVWLERTPYLIWGQIYAPTGERSGPPFQISDGSSFRAPVAAAAGDGFVVAWHGQLSAEPRPEGIQARLYDRAGHPRGEPLTIALQGEQTLSAPVLATDASDRAWVAWLGGRMEINVREIGADGSLGPAPAQGRPSLWGSAVPLAMTGWGEGNLVVAWERKTPDYSLSAGLVGQRLASRESPGVLRVELGRIAVAEGGGPVTLEVERREGTLGAVSVDYTVYARSAREGVDFLPVSGTLTFAEGESSPRSVTVPVLDDAFPEGNETLFLELAHSTGGARLGSPSRVRIEIRDDDVPSPLLQNAGGIAELDTAYTFEYAVGGPRAAALAGGGFVVLWEALYRHEVLVDLRSRLYGPDGRELARGVTPTPFGDGVHLVAQPGGGFTAVSSDYENSFGQRFDPRGRPLTEKFVLPGIPAAIAAGRAGGLLTLWQKALPAGGREISLIAYGTRGHPLGPRQIVSASPACGRTPPTIASDRSGRAVVVWLSSNCERLLVRRTDASGHLRGEEVDVLPPGTSAQIGRIGLAVAPDGRFVVVWEGDGDGDLWGIFARLFGSDGQPLGPVFQVNNEGKGDQLFPQVAMQGDGRFLVIWQSPGEQSPWKLLGQYFAASGQRLGGDFPVDSQEPGAEEVEAWLATDADGRYVMAWKRARGDTINERRLFAPPE